MNNFIQKGITLDLIAPAGGVASGKTVKIGAIIAVPGTTKPEGQPFAGTVEGVFDVDAKTAQAWDAGATVYWDDAAKVYTTTANANTKAGYAVAAKEAAAATGRVKLIPSV
jgi:predicted RecA/RadA family phage recombinase